MFAKLLKHEFRSVKGILSGLSVAALGAGALGALMIWLLISQIEQLQLTDSINGTVMVAAVILFFGIYLALLAYAIAGPIILYLRFYRNKFTDEGYLTFTLPVNTHQVLLSSILNLFIWETIVSVVLILSLAIMLSPLFIFAYNYGVFNEAFMEGFQLAWNEVMTLYGAGSIASQIFSSICSLAYGLVMPLLSITIGSLIAKKHKILASIGIFYGISMAVSTISSIFSMTSMLSSMVLSGGNIDSIMSETIVAPSVLMLIIGVGGYFLMHYLVKKKLNLP